MMTNESTKEFRITDYVHAFEKSLNYLAGAILAVLAAGIGYIASIPEHNISLLKITKNIHDNPQKMLCVLTAVLSTLPYYVYYTLKENADWNICNGKRDHLGLLKIAIMYEICIMNCFYLLFQGDARYAGSKLAISIVNIVLVSWYLILLRKRSKEGEHIGYFIAVIISALLFFIGLSINSLYNLAANLYNQDGSVGWLMMLFLFNSGINIKFLTKTGSTGESGIIYNRIKILVPIISISIFTVSLTYCFFRFPGKWGIMLLAAIWITLYEVVISSIKFESDKIKVIVCVLFFVIFVFVPPWIIWNSKSLPHELAADWFTLIGISIYCAAIKYWGYILKFLFVPKGNAESKHKLMNVMVWYRNSILGSMLLILAVLLPSGRLYMLLITILFCSLFSEGYIFHIIFKGKIENREKEYSFGRFIEFFAIIIPVIVFSVEKFTNWDYKKFTNLYVELPPYIEIGIAILAVWGGFVYILYKWNGKITVKSFGFTWKDLLQDLVYVGKHLWTSDGPALQDKNVGSFWTVVLTWSIYVLLAAVYLCIVPGVAPYRTFGMPFIISIVLLDFYFLSKGLLDYYIGKLKEGWSMNKFRKVFQKSWMKCLDTLEEFKETDAKQFYVGDRLRPILFFFGSSYGRYGKLSDKDYEMIAQAACSLELIHKSSVMFDDYIDNDTMRKSEQTFHVQYTDTHILILLGNAMLAKAQINFANCKHNFKCSEDSTIKNMQGLSKIVMDLCTGCYREINRADYSKQSLNDIEKIIYLETVSLIKGSIGLGYSCFHEDQGHKDRENLEELGEAFGYVFQYLNDLEPFSQKDLYEQHKGSKSNFDYGKKNVAMLILYQKLSDEEKKVFDKRDYGETIKLYDKYDVEQVVLNKVTEKMDRIKQLLGDMKSGNDDWINAFKFLFNLALKEKNWKDKVTSL